MSSPQGEEVAAFAPVEPAESTKDNEKAVAFEDNVTAVSPSKTDSDQEGTPAADIPDDLDEESALKALSATVRDQDDLERDISHQASVALLELEENKDNNRISRATARKLKFMDQKQAQQQKLVNARGKPTLQATIQKEIARIDAEIELIEKDIADITARIEERRQAGPDKPVATDSAKGRLPGESHRDFLIRTGKITPFTKIGGSREGIVGDLANAIVDAEDEAVAEDIEHELAADQIRSHRNLRVPGFAEEEDDDLGSGAVASEFSLRPRKKRKTQRQADSSDEFEPASAGSPESILTSPSEDYDMTDITRTKARKRPKSSKATEDAEGTIDFSKIDDGNESAYRRRLADWIERRSRARRRRQERDGLAAGNDDDEKEWFKPSPDQPDHQFEGGLKLPGDIYPSLYDYQKTGVQWLGELFDQKVGGIVGDEMGLGKTIQIISFLAALHYSKKLTRPTLIVAPATVLQQWVEEFHKWWPPMRVSILHSSGSGMLNVRNEGHFEDDDMLEEGVKPTKSSKSAKKIVDRVLQHGHVLVTTYAGLQTYGDVLIPVEWDYAVLDEGHKIRNPNTAVTILCKELLTPNRIILSGTPMQNNLIELWSIFDFINPMRLGSLVAFRNQFEVPIRLGGYANATNVQVMTAQKCAETLKDAISPYLLMRNKNDVAADLPKKREQVLFCGLTKWQQNAYEVFLRSEEVSAILKKTRNSLYGIDHLRKICNHPDLVYPNLKKRTDYKWGAANKSGKMQVTKSLVTMFKRLGHKTLLFSQSVQMLDILEAFVRGQDGIGYVRMDGKTAVKERQRLVDQFNNDPKVDLFLLTTKVGGLGVNLTGANRVIIYDPDWNPSTDIQARERAWRLGQKREVSIYRLMTAGTIEEKIYQRQIWKQVMANKVLKDPTQRASLNESDLQDLFSLGTDHSNGTETGRIFKGSEVKSDATPKPKLTPGSGNYDLGDRRAEMEALVRNEKAEEDKELQGIDGVAGLEEYKVDEEGGDANQEEDRIMAGIFSKGVHEALEHDEVMSGVNGKKAVRPDRAILQREADRVAGEAAQHLRRSGQQAENVPIGTVTWTGEVGEAGRPRQIQAGRARVGGLSSGVLSGIRGRQGIAGGSASSSRSVTPTSSRRPLGVKDFKEMIPPFLRLHGGKAPSKVLVDHFNPHCQTKKSIDAFRAALDVVAKLEQRGSSSMRSIWALKPDYK